MGRARLRLRGRVSVWKGRVRRVCGWHAPVAVALRPPPGMAPLRPDPRAAAGHAPLLDAAPPLRDSSFCSTASAYAAVLPEPVRARMRRSLPLSASGSARACTSVGYA
jgi:hypothetical protein